MNLTEFIDASKRILMVSKKPDSKEFKLMIKITGIGIVIIALIGYIIALFFTFSGVGV